MSRRRRKRLLRSCPFRRRLCQRDSCTTFPACRDRNTRPASTGFCIGCLRGNPNPMCRRTFRSRLCRRELALRDTAFHSPRCPPPRKACRCRSFCPACCPDRKPRLPDRCTRRNRRTRFCPRSRTFCPDRTICTNTGPRCTRSPPNTRFCPRSNSRFHRQRPSPPRSRTCRLSYTAHNPNPRTSIPCRTTYPCSRISPHGFRGCILCRRDKGSANTPIRTCRLCTFACRRSRSLSNTPFPQCRPHWCCRKNFCRLRSPISHFSRFGTMPSHLKVGGGQRFHSRCVHHKRRCQENRKFVHIELLCRMVPKSRTLRLYLIKSIARGIGKGKNKRFKSFFRTDRRSGICRRRAFSPRRHIVRAGQANARHISNPHRE